MSYQVTKSFTDKNTNSIDAETGAKHVYWTGDKYPTKGGYVGATTKARISELIDGGWIEEVQENGN